MATLGEALAVVAAHEFKNMAPEQEDKISTFLEQAAREVVVRESAVHVREKEVSQREADLHFREGQVAHRLAALERVEQLHKTLGNEAPKKRWFRG